MLELEGLQTEGERAVADLPLPGQVEEFPLAPAFGTAVVVGVRLFPAGVRFFRRPDDLGIGPDEKVIPEPLQLFPAGGVEKFVFGPLISQKHGKTSLQCLNCSAEGPLFQGRREEILEKNAAEA